MQGRSLDREIGFEGISVENSARISKGRLVDPADSV